MYQYAIVYHMSLLNSIIQSLLACKHVIFSYDYCSWGYTFLSRNKCRGGHWGPIQDGGRADISAPIGSVSLWGVYVYEFKLPRGASSREQMRLLGHVNTKQRCEIQSVWNSWIQRRTQAEEEKHCATRQSEGFSICTSPLFTMDLLCNIHCTMALKCGIFKCYFITGVMVYNYSKYVWLRQL